MPVAFLRRRPAASGQLYSVFLIPLWRQPLWLWEYISMVYSCTEAEHEQHLRTVMDLLRQHNLMAEASKCELVRSEV